MEILKIKTDPLLVNVLEMFKNEIKEKYDFFCLQSMHYRNEHLVIYDISTNLKEMWEYHSGLDISFIECICIQLRIMEMMGITFYAISMEDVYVLQYDKPIFIVIADVIKCKDTFTLISPSFKHPFDEYLFYPEMMKKKLPCTCSKTAIYYTIGLIVFAFQFGYPEWNNGYYFENVKVIDYIEKIKGCKLYFFLKRCFQYELFYI